MGVLQRVFWLPNERVDVPDARAIEAYALNDWRFFVSGILSDRSLVVAGFDVANYASIFSSPGFKVKLSDISLIHPEATGQGAGFYVSAGSEADETVNLSAGSTNYIEADLSVDGGSMDTRAFWDQGANAGAGAEYTADVNTVINLQLQITSNVSGFTAGKLPLYKAITNGSGIITSLTDCRNLLFRLGTGGGNPDPTYDYIWPSYPDAGHARQETASTAMSYSTSNAPFQGGDKNLKTFKDWMNAIMTCLKELKATPFWYSSVSTGSIPSAFQNAVLTILEGGTWQHQTGQLGKITLLSGSSLIRLGKVNNLILSSLNNLALTTYPTLYMLLPSTDVVITYGLGNDGLTAIAPTATISSSPSSITVAVGGNYIVAGGKILAHGQEYTYTSYNTITGAFADVSPDPSGIVQPGDIVYQLDSAGLGYYHTSAASSVPSIVGSVSHGVERTLWLAHYDGTSKIYIKNGDLEEGEQIQVSDETAINLLDYIGSPSEASTAPGYSTDATGAKTGQYNYNAVIGENLTTRISRLTSMMFDKAQDKQIRLVRESITTITNVTSGASQDLTFAGAGPKMRVVTPNGPTGYVGLTGTLSLAINEAAYFSIDRNAAFSIVNLAGLTIAPIASIPVSENIFLFAARLGTTSVYLWDGRKIDLGVYPADQDLTVSVRDRIGVLGEDTYEGYSSTQMVQTTDSYPTAVSRLDTEVYDLLHNSGLEEKQEVGIGGQSIFNATTLQWNASNLIWDVLVFVNGRKQSQDTTGGLAEDFRKNSGTQIEFSYTVPENAKVTFRVENPLALPMPVGFFRTDQVATGGITAFVGHVYNMGNDSLQAFRNGVQMDTLGLYPITSYIENSNKFIKLGLAASFPEVLSYIGLPTPTYRQFNSSLTGTVLSVPTYTMGDERLLVLRNGLLMNTASMGGALDQYSETSTTSITLTSAAVANEIFEYLYLASITSRDDVTGVTGTVIVVPTAYTMGNQRLLVFKNGTLMFNSLTLGGAQDRYQETSTTSITTAAAAVATDVFTFINV